MSKDRSPGSQHNVWRHHNLRCSKAGARSGCLQVLNVSVYKLQRKPAETIFYRCSRAANSIVSDGIWAKFKLTYALMYVLVTYKNEEDQMQNECARVVWSKHYAAIF